MISEYYYYYIIIYIVEIFGENMTTLRKVKLSTESCVTYACIFPDHYAPCLSCLPFIGTSSLRSKLQLCAFALFSLSPTHLA